MTILDEILTHKREEVAAAKLRRAPAEIAAEARAMSGPTRGFRRALLEGPAPAVIAEIKHRSPSKGVIRTPFDPVACARSYVEGGAAALSVLTDEHYFGGHLDYLREVRARVELPLLRKDFVVDPYQIDEARVAGADAVLLIVAALDPPVLKDLHAHARGLALDVLVEVHDESEMDTALDLGADLVGVNNRDLRTFHTDLSVTERLADRIPVARRVGAGGADDEGVALVAESGIAGPADVARLERAGARAFLVGESLMREPDPGRALRDLRRRT